MEQRPDSGEPKPGEATATSLDGLLARVALLPELADCDVRLHAPVEPRPIDLAAALAGALARPLAAPPLAELARGRRSAAIITSDATRAVPNRRLLPAVVAALNEAGIADEAIDLVVGPGAHRGPTDDELVALFGREWLSRLRVRNHDCRGETVSVGTTPAGNEVLIDPVVAAADLRIAFGQVEAHEFAGFTGGPKAILPAVSGYETIVRNHSIAMMSHPAARPGVVEGNPIHAEMAAAARLAGLEFVVNVVLDAGLRPLAVGAGEPLAVQAELAAFVRGYAGLTLPDEAPDVVVTGPGRPLDLNLYQTIKPLVAVEPLVDEDTVIVLAADCPDGTGSEDMLLPFAGARTPADVLAGLANGYTIEKDHAFFIARFLERCPTVVAVCPGVSDDDLRRLWFEPAQSVDEAVRRALGRAR
ncbi:MAG TPA: nickel-dependent lactate racemase, partial [Thermoleophilia bacterium]|nr:nickel-dependent lactate racemase [Thermoleophilia bacterium]